MSTLQGMFIIQRCAPARGFCQTNKSCKDVHQRDVCAWQRCPPSRVVNLAGVSTLQGSLSYRCLYLLEVSTLQGMSTIQRCAPGRGVCQTNKSCRGVRQRGVCLTEMSTFLRCLLYWVIHLTGVSTFKGFYHTDTLYLHLAKMWTLRGCLPYRFVGVYQTELYNWQRCTFTFQIHLYIWQECPFLKGGCNTVVHLTGCEPFRGVISVMCTWLRGCLSQRVVPLRGCEFGRDVHLAGVFDKPDARVHLRRLFTL